MAKSHIPIRACRDGNWQAVDLVELTPSELEQHFLDRGATELRQWIERLVDLLRAAEDPHP